MVHYLIYRTEALPPLHLSEHGAAQFELLWLAVCWASWSSLGGYFGAVYEQLDYFDSLISAEIVTM